MDMETNTGKCVIWAVIVLVVCLCVALCCMLFAGVGFWSIGNSVQEPYEDPDFLPGSQGSTETLAPPHSSQSGSPSADLPEPTFVPQPTLSSSEVTAAVDTLKKLQQCEVPQADMAKLAERLAGKANIPELIDPPPAQPKLGDRQKFWASNTDTNKNFQVDATLRHVSEHAYFWVEDGVTYNERDLQKLADTFSDHIYETDREFFGSEWSPGIDSDPRLYILFARGIGSSIAGYFSSADAIHPMAHEYSNAHEMFFLSADNVVLNEDYAYSVLAHEFQHMIHWYRDRNEESWLNEGFSELAVLLNGYSTGGFDYEFAGDPDLQLTDWPSDHNATPPHYGAGFLFTAYFLDRFGEKATQALVAHPQNGLASVDAVLSELNVQDPQTKKPVNADDVFVDWTVANLVNDPSVGDGRYVYSRYNGVPEFYAEDTISDCPSSWESGSVYQYGTDYVEIACDGKFVLEFEGTQQVGVLAAQPHSGKYYFWSNKGDESDMTLTRSFDLSNASGKATLSYWTWYDLEKDFDYLYVLASEDGQKWSILKTPSGTDEDPSGNSYGWGYNGSSGGWIEESVDLSAYAGKKVQVRFEYVTDAAVNGEGLLLDDIQIPEIGYQTDFERDEDGWEAAGFVRIENSLPQTYRVTLVQPDAGKVEYLTIDASQQLRQEIDLRDGATLIINGTARYTRQAATYRFRLVKP